ncbi:MAG: protein-glutamate O-methyltransferase CheR [Gammaproteobacteria bacterium]
MAYLDSSTESWVLASTKPADSVDVLKGSISSSEYTHFCSFLEKNSGIVLGQNKEYLVTNRLRVILEDGGFKSLGELLGVIESRGKSTLYTKVIDAMTTNETLWFRDKHPFEILRDVILPELSSSSAHQLRIWSAASSTGQEAYSISITINEFLQKKSGSLPKNVEIVATDISQNALQHAKEGIYDPYEVTRGLSENHQRQYFDREGQQLRLKPEIKQSVRFQQLNLLESYSGLGNFDVIFCRNVLIYFSDKIKSEILSRMAKALKPGGYLFLGGSEPIANYSDQFEMVRCKQGVVYRSK